MFGYLKDKEIIRNNEGLQPSLNKEPGLMKTLTEKIERLWMIHSPLAKKTSSL
jgi:hypothetical protein